MFAKKRNRLNKRRYIRLDSVFPVQFRLVSLDGEKPLSDTMQGFTSNISKGGICLEVNELSPNLINLLKNQEAKLSLKIEVPFGGSMQGSAVVIWVKKGTVNKKNKYLFGLDYDKVNASQCKKIVRYAWTKKVIVPVLAAAVILLGLGVILNSYTNIRLLQGNKALVEQLVKIFQEFSIAKQEIKYINKEKKNLQLKIEASDLAIKTLKEEKANLGVRVKSGSSESKKIKNLELKIEETSLKKNFLLEELFALQNKENSLTEELLRLDKKKETLGKADLDNIYQWLKIDQNPGTGLVASFSVDKDKRAKAFTYEQALMIQAYTNFSDLNRAKKILDFFLRQEKEGGRRFADVYYADDGLPADSAGIHNRPDICLGIAVMQYTFRTKDTSYLILAEELADKIIKKETTEAGSSNSPSSEDEVEVYSFLNMLYEFTKKREYLDAKEKILSHLAEYEYEGFEREVGKFGRNVSTFTDQIMAIGPDDMGKFHINPDRVVEIIERNFSAEVNYLKPGGKTIMVKGIDFLPDQQFTGAGAVFPEATAKMVLSLRIMADFYYKKGLAAKARNYELKADEYLASLGNMVLPISLPSGKKVSYLPYAVGDSIPGDKIDGAVSATVYALFAYYNYNPLELKD